MKIKGEFQGHELNEHGKAKVDDIREAFSECLSRVQACVGDCRERSIVVTKMQEACMFAIRAVSVQAEYQRKAPVVQSYGGTDPKESPK